MLPPTGVTQPGRGRTHRKGQGHRATCLPPREALTGDGLQGQAAVPLALAPR